MCGRVAQDRHHPTSRPGPADRRAEHGRGLVLQHHPRPRGPRPLQDVRPGHLPELPDGFLVALRGPAPRAVKRQPETIQQPPRPRRLRETHPEQPLDQLVDPRRGPSIGRETVRQRTALQLGHQDRGLILVQQAGMPRPAQRPQRLSPALLPPGLPQIHRRIAHPQPPSDQHIRHTLLKQLHGPQPTPLPKRPLPSTRRQRSTHRTGLPPLATTQPIYTTH